MFLTNLELGKKIKILREFKNISRIDFATRPNNELKLTLSDPNYLNENKIHKYESGKKKYLSYISTGLCKSAKY